MADSVLITGGGGFIGSSLALQLTKRGDRVTVIDSFTPQIHGADYRQSPLFERLDGVVNIVPADIRDRDALKQCLGSANRVVHLAAETGTGQSMYEIDSYVSVNLGGTGLLLDLIANDEDINIERLVVASSRAVYGEGKYHCEFDGEVYPISRESSRMRGSDFAPHCPVCDTAVDPLPTDEASKKHAASLYGITKSTQEDLFLNIGASLDIPTVALRYQNVYGPGQSLQNPYTGILSIFSTRILNGNPIDIYEDGLETRDFVYIDDVVTATISALDAPVRGQVSINVGTGVPVSVNEVVRLLGECFEREVDSSVSGRFRVGDIRHNYADLELAERLLDFTPSMSFAEGVVLFTDWVKTLDIQKDNYERSVAELKEKGLIE